MTGRTNRARIILKILRRAASNGYARCIDFLLIAALRLRKSFFFVLTESRRIIRKLWDGLPNFRRSSPRRYPYYRHSLPLRIMHWSNVLFLAVLLMSGLGIFNVHPALNWGKQSYKGKPPLLETWGRENDKGEVSGITTIFGRDFDTTGFLGASESPTGEMIARGFPHWLTLPPNQWLAMARRWHFFFAWLLAINGIAFVAHSIVSGHVRRDLLPNREDWRSIGKSIVDHLRFRHESGEAAKRYNVLQKSAYLGVIFFLLPLIILMGLGMSPALDALRPGWVDIFFGRQSIRTIHFVVAWALVLFTAIHVFEVVITGLWNNLRSMITGYYRVESADDHGK